MVMPKGLNLMLHLTAIRRFIRRNGVLIETEPKIGIIQNVLAGRHIISGGSFLLTQ